MAHQVTIGAGKTNVQLPNGLAYNDGDVVVLTDDEFALINADEFTNGTLVDNGEVDAADAVSAQATHVAAVAALTSAQIATANATDLATAEALANATKAAYNQLQADVAAIRTTLNNALAAMTGTGKPMA